MSRGLHQFKSRLKLGRFMFLLVGFLSARLGFSAPVTPPAGVALTDLTDSYGRQFEIGDSLYGGAFDNDVTASAPTGQGMWRVFQSCVFTGAFLVFRSEHRCEGTPLCFPRRVVGPGWWSGWKGLVNHGQRA